MLRISAGLLMYRYASGRLECLLVHPGGPFWKNKDAGIWTIPKGEVSADEDLLSCAKREFAEETGFTAGGECVALAPIKQKSGKIVHAWAFEGDCDPANIKSNVIAIEWPPGSGKRMQIPEVDRGEFFEINTARKKINPAQIPFLEEVASLKSKNA